jgi:valyl-tRNA synthetase
MRDVRLEKEAELSSALAAHGVKVDAGAAAAVTGLKELTSQVRAFKADNGEAAKKDSQFIVEASEAQWALLEANLAKLKRMMGAAEISRGAMSPNAPACVTPLGSWNLIRHLKAGDTAAEKVRLTKELETVSKHIAGTEGRLSNEAFVSKAPPAVLDGARKQLADLRAKKSEVERLLASLG